MGTVSLTGRPAPGTASTFALFTSLPAVSRQGDVVFRAFTASGLFGVWKADAATGQVELVALQGQSAPGTTANFGTFGVPVFDAGGAVLFSSSVSGESLWRRRPGSELELVLARDTAAEAGTFLPLAVCGCGTIAFELSGLGSPAAGIFKLAGPAPSLLARAGDPAPLGPAGATFSTLYPPVIDPGGSAAFLADLAVGGDPAVQSIWRDLQDSLAPPLAIEGSEAPGTGGLVFTSLDQPAIGPGGHIAFAAGLTDPTGMHPNRTSGVFTGLGRGDLAPVAVRASATLTAAGEVDFLAFTSPVFGNRGELYFGAHSTAIEDFDRFGTPSEVWKSSTGGLEPVLAAGTVVPGTARAGDPGDRLFFRFLRIAVNGGGELAFLAELAIPHPNPAVVVTRDPNDIGLWLLRGSGLELVARAREPLEVAPGEVRTVRTGESLAFLSGERSITDSFHGGPVDGRARGYSDDGRIAFRAMFTDNSSGLFYADFRSTSDELVVNSQGDAPDKDLDDGVCDTGNMVIGQGGAPTAECTLRAAIAEANAQPNVSKLAFAIHGEDGLRLPFPVIRQQGDLPEVVHPARIDGTTQTGLDQEPSVAIDGGGHSGLVFRGVQGGESLVFGLAFNRHASAALRIDGCREPIVVGDCRVGGTSNSAELGSIEGFGIQIIDSSNVTIGGQFGDANTIQGASLSGVYIEGDSPDNVVSENEIRSNRLNGIRVAGGASQRNKISRNSIHENGEEGILLADGANDEIAAPVIDRSYYLGKTVLTGRTSVGAGTVEVFVDPVVVGAEPWFWGQGFRFVFTLTADPEGNFAIDLGQIVEQGVVTATVTDSLGNTSQFSPFFSATLTQTVPSDPPLLVAGKPVAIRLHGDTGINSSDTENVSLKIDVREGDRVRSEEKTLELSGFEAYATRETDRRRGLNTPLVLIQDPLPGDLEVFFELRRGGVLRGRGKLGPFPVQETTPPRIGLVPLSILGPDGEPSPLPQDTNMLEAASYVAAVYPVDPDRFMRSVALLPSMRFDGQPTGDIERARLLRVLDAARLDYSFSASTRTGLTHILGFVKEDAALGVGGYSSPYSMGIPVGVLRERSTYLKSTVMPISVHAGPTMAHELGHQVPFLLGDEYERGQPREANPIPADARLADGYGIFILEEHLAFNPTGMSLGPSEALPDFPFVGPLWTPPNQPAGDFQATVRSFMGNTAFAWTSRRCHEHLFQAMGGSIPGEGGGRGGAGAPAGPAPAEPLIARGVVTAAGEGLLLPLSRSGRPSEPPPPAPEASTYLLELQDAGGTVLSSRTFPLTFVTEVFKTGEDGSEDGPSLVPAEAAPFSVILDDSPAAARLVLKRGETVLATRQKSPNPPSITLLAPHGPGALAGNTVEVRWQAADPDPGDEAALVATILYTPDGGATVLPVAVELQGRTSFTVGLDELPGGSAARFIVRVTDGWHQAEDASDPALSLLDRTPSAFVRVQWGDEGPPVGETVSILGLAHDPEDGVLTGAALEWWVDDSEESQGTGVIFRTAFAEGEHTVRLTATDSTGKSVTAEVRIVAGGCAPGDCAPRFLRGDCDGDGRIVGVTDAIKLLGFSFLGAPKPPCLAACDANGDGRAVGQITDAVYILLFSYLGGPPPVAPFPACGDGNLPTDPAVGCEVPLASCR